jgi:hypothetical protein
MILAYLGLFSRTFWRIWQETGGGMRKKTTIGSPDFWGTPIVALLGKGRVE